MRSGKRPRGSGGFTYVAMLVCVAVLGAGLAATGEVWSLSRQREQEAELLYVGNQYRQAIGWYYEATPGGGQRFPDRLEDLVEDKRFPMPKRHLRRLYPDPMTGRAEWGLIEAPGGGIMGVYSLSKAAPVKRSQFAARDRTFNEASGYDEWRFIYERPLASGVVGREP